MEYTVHFQKGQRDGTQSLAMERVESATALGAQDTAKKVRSDLICDGYRITRVDHIDTDGYLVVD